MAESLVWRDPDGYYNFKHPDGYIYDFRVTAVLTADYWITTLPGKSWVTDAHMAEFKNLLAVNHG
jgi:hypothetical protein